MKRVIAIMLVFSMCFTLFSCKEADEDTAKPLEKLQNENKNEQGEIKQEQSENTEGTPNVNEQESQPEKEEPRYTIEDDFSPYEVIVTLTKQETDLKKEYTEKDFPNADVFYVVQNQDYYGNPNFKDAYPEYQDKTTLFMYLNTPSKQNVLDTIEKLKQDERIFDADVCFSEIISQLHLYLSDKYLEESDKYSVKLESFGDCKATKIDYTPEFPTFTISDNQLTKIALSFENLEDTFYALKLIKDDERFKKIIPYYPYYLNEICFKYIDDTAYKWKKYTAEDFPEFSNLEILNISSRNTNKDFYNRSAQITVSLAPITYKSFFKLKTKLQALDKYESVFLMSDSYTDIKNNI